MRIWNKVIELYTDGKAVGEVVQSVTHDDHPRRWRDGGRRQAMTMMMMMMMIIWWLLLFHGGVVSAEFMAFQTPVFDVVWLPDRRTTQDCYNRRAQIPLGPVPRNFLADLLATSPTSP